MATKVVHATLATNMMYKMRLCSYFQGWAAACRYDFRVRYMGGEVYDKRGNIILSIDIGHRATVRIYGTVRAFIDHPVDIDPPRWLCLSCPGVAMVIGPRYDEDEDELCSMPYSCWCGQPVDKVAGHLLCKHCEKCKAAWCRRKADCAMWILLGAEILPRELATMIGQYLADVLACDA